MLSSNSSRGQGHEHHHHDLSDHHHHHQDPLEIKQNDKFFSRLMSKEISMANSSSRVYYRTDASSSVPFMWESRPGTPKHTSNDTTLPPLTPPPSYLSKSVSKKNNNNNNNESKNLNGTSFLTSINVFSVKKKKKKNKNKNNVTPSSSWSSKSSSLSSSSSSSSSSTLSWSSSSCYSFSNCSRLHNSNNVHYIDNDHDGDQHACRQDHDHHDHAYPSSTTCFGVKAKSFNESSRGRYSMVKMKNALRSIVGHGSSGHQGTT